MSLLRSRAPFGVVLALSVAAGAYMGDPTSVATTTPREQNTAGVSAALASGRVRSAAWYCAIASPTRDVLTDAAVVMSNTGTERVAVEIVGISNRRAVGRRRLEISGNNSTRVPVSSFGVKSGLGVIVEVFGSGVVVEHSSRVNAREASTACATQPGTHAYFGAATTRKNVRQTLALMNPFGQSAVIDVSLLTADGLLRPTSMQAVEVAARSKVTLSVNGGADQQQVLSIEASARSGRFVAESMLVGTKELASSPISLQSATPSLAKEWHLADFDVQRGETHRVLIANPGDAAIDVNILTLRAATIAVEQRTERLEPGTVRAVGPTANELQQDDVSVIVNSQQPFAVGSLVEHAARGQMGVSIGSAMARSSTRWAFAVDHTELLDASVWIVIENESASDAAVEIVGAAGGIRRKLVVPSQQRMSVRLPNNTVVSVLTVTADQRVFISRRMAGSGGISRSPGVPTL